MESKQLHDFVILRKVFGAVVFAKESVLVLESLKYWNSRRYFRIDVIHSSCRYSFRRKVQSDFLPKYATLEQKTQKPRITVPIMVGVDAGSSKPPTITGTCIIKMLIFYSHLMPVIEICDWHN